MRTPEPIAEPRSPRRHAWLVPSLFIVLTGMLSTVTYGTIRWLRSDTATVSESLDEHAKQIGHAVLVERNQGQQTAIQRQLEAIKADVRDIKADVKTLLTHRRTGDP